MGNLIPLIVWLPLAVWGVLRMAAKGDYLGPGLWMLVAATILGWLALNRFGLFENEHMKAQLGRILTSRGDAPIGGRTFVGFASPRYSSAVDPHEDVGFLFIEPTKLTFVSETRTVDVLHEDVKVVRFRGNAHSWVGLGRWVSVEGAIGERPIRLNLEPREHRTLLQNRRDSARLLKKLRDWLKG